MKLARYVLEIGLVLRPHKRLLLSSLLGLCLLAIGLNLPSRGYSSSGYAHSVNSQGVVSATDLLNSRSPGGRAAGALYQTKPDYTRATPIRSIGPMRVLPVVRTQPVFAPYRMPSDYADTLPVENLTFTPDVEPLDYATSVPHLTIIPGHFVIPSGPLLPGGPIVVSPVPETSTWITMILGITMMGWTLRRSKRKRSNVILAQPLHGSSEKME